VRLAAYEFGGTTAVGIVEGETVRTGGSSLFDVQAEGTVLPLEQVRLRSPVRQAQKIIGVGLNYPSHVAESVRGRPEIPMLFSKFSNALIGPGDPIVLSPLSTFVDYEAELGVVIGTQAHRVSVEAALDFVLGYTCANDVSARDLQHADPQWVRAKGLDTFCPLGPWIVTTDEIPDPQVLGLRGYVNGELRQEASTGEMLFSVAEIISFISQGLTLEPGDVIVTGTPGGIGWAMDPPVALKPGDQVCVEIEGIGRLVNPVVAPNPS
jgi:2-keto-4-pentenoate hydratase/2-oxohepta-3-ene-1,7-dioic acid hydratase in catechol pathway